MVLLAHARHANSAPQSPNATPRAGAAGSGKSLLLRKMVAELRRHHAEGEVVVCAPTGIAAVNVAGVTIHSFAGIGLGRGAFEQVLGRVLKNAGACQASQSL